MLIRYPTRCGRMPPRNPAPERTAATVYFTCGRTSRARAPRRPLNGLTFPMNRRLLRLVTCVLPLVGCGCSGVIANAGKDVESLLRRGATRNRIEALVGPPVRQETFHAESLPSTRRSDDTTVRASSFAEYRYRGRADDLEQFQDIGMLVGLTLGIGEVVAFPMALGRSHELQNGVHDYRVWYDADGKCVAHEAEHSHYGPGG